MLKRRSVVMKNVLSAFARIILSLIVIAALLSLPLTCLAGTISGYISDDAGDPLGDVSVQAYSGQCHNGDLGQSTTDASGNYSIDTIPDGTQVYLWADSSSTGGNYTQEWYDGGTGTPACWLAQPVDDDAVGVNFVLERSGSITGTVIDAANDPINDMHIYATLYDADCNGNWLSGTNTGTDGVYTLDHLPPGEVVLRTCSECSELDYVNEYYDGALDCGSATTINVTAGNTIAGKDFQLDLGGTISGYVKTKEGSHPIENANVDIYTDQCHQGHLRGTPTDASGYFEFRGLPLGIQYILRADASSSGQNYISQWYDNVDDTENCNDAIWVNIGDTIVFNVVEGGTVSGTIINSANNLPIKDVSVDVSIIQGEPCGPHQYVMGRYSNPLDGTFTLDGIPPGDYFLRTYPGDSNFISEWWNASGSSMNCADAQSISISSGDTIMDRGFQLEEGGAVSGHVHDDGGQPLANVHVFAQEASCNGQWLAGANTDDQGFYRIQGILPGSVYIRTDAASNGYNFIDEFWDGTPDCGAAAEISVEAGAETPNIDFNLSPGATISGNVASGGQPLEGISVHVFADRCGSNGWVNHLGGAQTDANGDYQIDGLPVADVFVLACPGCDNRNYFDRWYDGSSGIEDCNQAMPVSVLDGGVTSDIDFDLPGGPRYLNWWDVAVYHGTLGVGFDLLPGFDPFLVSAVIDGPNGFTYTFDLQSDVLEWLNECSYLVSWNHDFSGHAINYGEYTLTLMFKHGAVKTYTHELVEVAVTPVDSDTMYHTVNDDGSIDFSWTNPDPAQRYQVRIYQGSERLYRSGMLNAESLHVSADSLKCLVLGEAYTWQMRAYDNHDPYYTCEKSNSLPLIYDPEELENRAKWFEATNYQGAGASLLDRLSLYFDTRPGSRDNITSATVTGPAGFTPYNVDLVNDWYDISTETRKNSGWSQFLSDPILDGGYTLTVVFDDGWMQTLNYDLSASPLAAVDVGTMNHDIYENGAIRFSWNLPADVTGQRYNVRVRSKDGSKEFVKSATYTDNTEMYLSPWDLRALIHGQTFQWFVQSSDSSGGSWIRSDSIDFVYDPFLIYAMADIDKDWDVDGSDLAALVQLIQNGAVGDVPGAVAEFAPRYGQLQ
jgi:hypothetical protein